MNLYLWHLLSSEFLSVHQQICNGKIIVLQEKYWIPERKWCVSNDLERTIDIK